MRLHLYQNLWSSPQTTQVMTVRHVVPNAAEVRGDGTLVYRLDADPQGHASDPAYKAAVRALTVPLATTSPRHQRWQADGRVAEFHHPAAGLPRWEVVAIAARPA